MRFRFSEVDVELTLPELLRTIALGVAICSAPFIDKCLLGFIL